MTRREMLNEVDMLEGNINRMCVTDDKKELEAMKLFAIRRLTDIYNCRMEELNKKDSDK